MKFLHSLAITAIILNLPLWSFTQQNQPARRELYQRCTSIMQTDPQAAYETCREYLQRYSDDDPRYVEFVRSWVTGYERVLPYINYLRTISAPDANARWLIYEPDLSIEIPQVTQREEHNPVEIVRSFRDEREAAMLRRAEDVYPSADEMAARVAREPRFFAQFAPLEDEPLWWDSAYGRIKAVSVITARAVRYYYDLSQDFRTNPQRRIPGWGRWITNLRYIATINHHEEYARGQETFRDVYVADLNLTWSQRCGGLCGAGYGRNKVVVLDRQGNVLAMFLDAPQNRGVWVS